ncbi:MAG: segregation/condensation protein A [Nanoarchaeota archaeon]|nr:segregation/condensation protein A [Nanoarchaeota archaeon]
MMAEETPLQNDEGTGQPAEQSREHHEHIYEILMNQDEITWRSIIIELIKTEQMDPWDINLSKLSKMYIKTLKKLKEMNLQLSGKVLLAAAILLRIKSSRLIGDDIMEFDRLLASGESSDDLYSDESFVEGEFGGIGIKVDGEQLRLVPRTPQPRKRKVSVYDLIDALAVALNVRRRRMLNQIQTRTLDVPEKPVDISQLMDDLYNDVIGHLTKEQTERMAFSDLVPGDSKEDKVFTFIPLLHLTNARRVDLEQQKHFGEIWVKIAKEGAAEKKEKLEKKRNKEGSKKVGPAEAS